MAKTTQPEKSKPTRSSVDPDEIAKFSARAREWWDPEGAFRALHKFNPVRLGFIRDTVDRHFGCDQQTRHPFAGMHFLDIGCGGGLVSEPMARLGATVTAIDASEANIKTAMVHARDNNLDIEFQVGRPEELVATGEESFDVVLNLEVVEHVENPVDFLVNCARMVKPGGMLITATLNRTFKAWVLAIVGAEHVLRWLPPGTHEFRKFMHPEEIATPLRSAGLHVQVPQGVSYNPLRDSWFLSRDTKVNYMIVATRPKS